MDMWSRIRAFFAPESSAPTVVAEVRPIWQVRPPAGRVVRELPVTLRTIVCLANSRKYGGRCVAGKEYRTGIAGSWIRPVSATQWGEVDPVSMTCADGHAPELLDLLTIPFEGAVPHTYQRENWAIDPTVTWTYAGRLGLEALPALCDDPPQLWVNGHSTAHGINDRIPVEIAERDVTTSLALIQPEWLRLVVSHPNDRQRVEGWFGYRGLSYRLVVTDPVIERRCADRADGRYGIDAKTCYLCVSLGEPYNGFVYKLIAAIIMPSAIHVRGHA